MKLRVRITKRGELWVCCEKWRAGGQCNHNPYAVEFFDELVLESSRITVSGEGPRVKHDNT